MHPLHGTAAGISGCSWFLRVPIPIGSVMGGASAMKPRRRPQDVLIGLSANGLAPAHRYPALATVQNSAASSVSRTVRNQRNPPIGGGDRFAKRRLSPRATTCVE